MTLRTPRACLPLYFLFVLYHLCKFWSPDNDAPQRREATKSASRFETLRLKYSTSFQQSSGRSLFFLRRG